MRTVYKLPGGFVKRSFAPVVDNVDLYFLVRTEKVYYLSVAVDGRKMKSTLPILILFVN